MFGRIRACNDRQAIIINDLTAVLVTLQGENTRLRFALSSLMLDYDEEAGTIDVLPEPSCQECTGGATPNKFGGLGLCSRHRALATLEETRHV